MAFGDFVEPAVDTDGNFLVAWVPTIADTAAPSAAVLNGASTKDLTYSLTPSGYARTGSQATDTDERLTLAQVLETPGKTTETLSLQYVHGGDGAVAEPVLVEGTKGFIVDRRAVPIGTAFTVGQKVDIIPVQVGTPLPDAPTSNGKFTKTVKLFITGTIKRGVSVVA